MSTKALLMTTSACKRALSQTDVLKYVFSFLNVLDICIISTTNKSFQDASKDPKIVAPHTSYSKDPWNVQMMPEGSLRIINNNSTIFFHKIHESRKPLVSNSVKCISILGAFPASVCALPFQNLKLINFQRASDLYTGFYPSFEPLEYDENFVRLLRKCVSILHSDITPGLQTPAMEDIESSVEFTGNLPKLQTIGIRCELSGDNAMLAPEQIPNVSLLQVSSGDPRYISARVNLQSLNSYPSICKLILTAPCLLPENVHHVTLVVIPKLVPTEALTFSNFFAFIRESIPKFINLKTLICTNSVEFKIEHLEIRSNTTIIRLDDLRILLLDRKILSADAILDL